MPNSSALPFSRPCWAEINVSALCHNAKTLARQAFPARLGAVVKANAYGHGAVEVARALEKLPEIAFLGVASVDEGLQLKKAGLQSQILLLSAVLPAEAAEIVRAGLIATVFSPEVAAALQGAGEAENRLIEAHFKVDTGMARLGVSWCEAAALWRQLQSFDRLRWRGIYTHFCCADEPDDMFSALQLKRFEEVLAQIDPPKSVLRHAANSAATLRYPAAHFDIVRPGIALYGIDPLRENGVLDGPTLDLKPVMTWKARVTALKNVAVGATVSYGATWKAARASKIAVVPAGYADGFSRALSNRGEVLVEGQKCSLVGRVTMDQILVDVSALSPQPQPGAEVILWGDGLPVEAVAARAGTISYELLCGVAARVPRVFLEGA